MRLVRRPRLIRGRPDQLIILLNQNAIQKYRHPRRTLERPVGLEMRSPKHDVVRLPLARRPCRIDEWRILPVDSARLAVRVRVVLVGIEHLELVDPHKEDAAVAALLAFTLRRS